MTPVELENTAIAHEEVEKLWKAFKVFDADGSDAISAKELGQVMRSLGHNPTDTAVRNMMKEVDLADRLDFEEFKALMVAKQDDPRSNLKLAFSVFDEDGSGQITANEMRSVMSKFGLTDSELDEMLKEVDNDGDGSINFDEFCCLMPDESEIKTGYKDAPIPLASSLNTTATSNDRAAVTNYIAATPKNAAPTTTERTPQEAATDIASQVAQLRSLLVQHPQPQSEKGHGTSRLLLQIGLFRLIQGAAYRTFRESFSVNHETHLRVKNLPYTITDFVQFVKKAVELYKGLGVVEEACYPVVDAVVESLTDEYARLEERIKNWKTVEKTQQMLAEEKAMLSARGKLANVKEKFAAGVEFALTMKKKNICLSDLVEGVLAINELNRLREMELNEDLASPPAKSESDPYKYLQKWNRVIIESALEGRC